MEKRGAVVFGSQRRQGLTTRPRGGLMKIIIPQGRRHNSLHIKRLREMANLAAKPWSRVDTRPTICYSAAEDCDLPPSGENKVLRLF